MGNLIDLTKKAQITLEKKGILNEKVNIVLALDISSSMRSLYSDKTIHNVIERILGIGMNMDYNKQIDIYLFGKHTYCAGIANAENYSTFVNDVILKQYSLENYTFYAGAMDMIMQKYVGIDYRKEASKRGLLKDNKGSVISAETKIKKRGLFNKLFGKKEQIVEELIVTDSVLEGNGVPEYEGTAPTVVFFITDGDCHDNFESEEMIRLASQFGVFWQFVGIGFSQFKFLKKLDENLDDRVIDNANFFQLNDINSISDTELYDRILNELPSWLKESRIKGITK